MSSRLRQLSVTRILGALRRRAQHFRVVAQYRPGKTPILKNTVLFESFQGELVGDSPLYIYYELRKTHPQLDFVWAVQGSAEAPEGSRSVKWGSAEWLRLLSSAEYLVNNANFPFFFRKAPGQKYLQTWHGTPLKRLGRDIPGAVLTVGYQGTMEREASMWDYLVAPNEYFIDVFSPAFRFSGKSLLTGYPRNDRLSTATEEERRKIRSRLGVDDDTVLVMYAPTWRDYQRTAGGNWDAVNYLDPTMKLPDGFRLMFRGHHNTISAHDANVAGGAIDVTAYPDITELCIAADVLITDYSSLMFDYTVTGKPVIFFAPDLERYRAERGFYLDYEQEVPGPIARTSAEVVETLAKLGDLKVAYAKKYDAWVKKYDSLEDGYAANRVVTAVWVNPS